MAELDADVIGLTEVDSRIYPGGSNQLEFLARGTGLNAVAGLTLEQHTGRFGNALLTKLPILEVRRHELTVPGRELRRALDVDLEVKGSRIRVIVTHLGLRVTERRTQVRRLLNALRQVPESPLVLVGDFNGWLGFRCPIRSLNKYFGRSPAPKTFPARFPMLALDRIWARPRGILSSVCAHRSSKSRIASDHLPLIAAVELSRM